MAGVAGRAVVRDGVQNPCSLQPVGGGRHETKDHTNKYVQAVRSDMKGTLDVTRTNSRRPDLV